MRNFKILSVLGLLAGLSYGSGSWAVPGSPTIIINTGMDSAYVQEIAGDSANAAITDGRDAEFATIDADSINTRALVVNGVATTAGLILGAVASDSTEGGIDTLVAGPTTNVISCVTALGCYVDISGLEVQGRTVTLAQAGGAISFLTTANVKWVNGVEGAAGELGVDCAGALSGQPRLQVVTLVYIAPYWIATSTVEAGGVCES